jgi:hypothetical protein
VLGLAALHPGGAQALPGLASLRLCASASIRLNAIAHDARHAASSTNTWPELLTHEPRRLICCTKVGRLGISSYVAVLQVTCDRSVRPLVSISCRLHAAAISMAETDVPRSVYDNSVYVDIRDSDAGVNGNSRSCPVRATVRQSASKLEQVAAARVRASPPLRPRILARVTCTAWSSMESSTTAERVSMLPSCA